MVNQFFLKKGLKIDVESLAQTPKGITFKFRPPCVLGSTIVKSNLVMGAYTYFETGRIGSLSSIGNYCSVAPGCTIGNGHHPLDFLTTHPVGFKGAGMFNFDPKVKNFQGGSSRSKDVLKFAPVIGHDVWIGGNVTIFRGVKIGNGAIIGANSLVNKDVPDFAIVGGTPARVIRYRFEPEIIEKLKALKWWNYDIVDAPEIDFSDVESAISLISKLINEGKLNKICDTREEVSLLVDGST